MSGETEQGRRRADRTPIEELQPGDYCKRGDVWWVCLPNRQLGRLDSRWNVTEHEDGTITVSPSIHDAPDGWHGWLERGVWRSV